MVLLGVGVLRVSERASELALVWFGLVVDVVLARISLARSLSFCLFLPRDDRSINQSIRTNQSLAMKLNNFDATQIRARIEICSAPGARYYLLVCLVFYYVNNSQPKYKQNVGPSSYYANNTATQHTLHVRRLLLLLPILKLMMMMMMVTNERME